MCKIKDYIIEARTEDADYPFFTAVKGDNLFVLRDLGNGKCAIEDITSIR